MTLLHRCLALTLCLGLAAADGLGPGRLAFRSYGAEQGLSSLTIWALAQDLDGFLWVGTEGGLFRYDGHRFQRFEVADGLPQSWTRSLFADPDGRLWIGTVGGLAVWDGGTILPVGPDQGLPQSEVYAMLRDPLGRLWIGTQAGLYRQITGTKGFERAPDWPQGRPCRTLWLDSRSLLATSGTNLFAYALPSAAQAVLRPGPWTQRLEGLARDAQGRLWVRSRTELWCQEREEAAFRNLGDRLPGPAFYDAPLSLDRRGRLLVPTTRGLVRIDGDSWDCLGEARGLPVPWANRALQDREGSLWVGSSGLHRSLGREVWGQYTFRDGIPGGGVVLALLRDRNGSPWMGTAEGLCRWLDGAWRTVPRTRGLAILALVQAPDGAIWMGGALGRLRRWEPATDRWTEFPEVTSTITDLGFDTSGRLWVATRRQGLFLLEGQPGEARLRRIDLPQGHPDERLETLATGASGRLWVGGALGLFRLENGVWTRFTEASGLQGQHVLAVMEEGDATLLVACQEQPGLVRYRVEGGVLRRVGQLGTAEGLPRCLVFFIRRDSHGRLWVGSDRGLAMQDRERLHLFGAGEGLPGDECTANGFLPEADGTVWIGTRLGLARFHADAFRDVPESPPAFIVSAQAGARMLKPSSLARIPHGEALEFRFGGLSFFNENRLRHQIRLVGMEDVWRDTDIRQARFDNLGPGLYRFEVRAAYAHGPWGAPAGIAFRMLPGWWQTWWFRGLLVLGGFGLVAMAVRVRIRALRSRNRELEELVHHRTEALEAANDTLRQLTVTDPLTGLRNRRFLDLTLPEDIGQVHRNYHDWYRKLERRGPINLDLIFFIVDIDHFKFVNDTYGHAAGDRVLNQVKDRLLLAVRDTDTVVRWGGEEFVVLARKADRSSGELLAGRILELMRGEPFDLGSGISLSRTCSLGYAPYPFVISKPELLPWEQVVQLADRCLYAAKASGRDAYVGLTGAETTEEEVHDFLANPTGFLAVKDWDVRTGLSPEKLQWFEEYRGRVPANEPPPGAS